MHKADVVLYDRLVSQEILAKLRPDAEKIHVGKQPKDHPVPQERINDLLVSHAREGKRVLRLKGGDPFIFGRGGEEALHLTRENIPFEIVPGITSSAGCAAYAGIPLTHRGLAHSVRFITGHLATEGSLELDWDGLADPETTLVVYMGLTNLAVICEQLISHGLAPDTPAAAINQGTRPQQRTVHAVLKDLADAVEHAHLVGATLLVIGKVAGLAQDLEWFNPERIEDGEADSGD
jgi:uroporphyrin-III C-methyltransferase